MVSIRYKILFVVIPVFVASMILLTAISTGFARLGMTKIASEFLGYKMGQIVSKADTEIDNLNQSEYANDPIYKEEIKKTVLDYAKTISKQGIETFVAVDKDGIIRLSDDPELPVGKEIDFFYLLKSSGNYWISFRENGIEKVGFFKYYKEWEYYFILSTFSGVFFYDSNKILQNSLLILCITLFLAFLLLQFFIRLILRPLQEMVDMMNQIIISGDSSKRVKIWYHDEIGEMAFTFNNMLEQLNHANNQIKEYAFQSVLQKKREERIKLMFQKYVPQDIIDEIVHNPDRALIGKNSQVAVLFSDIRSFTSISESMAPDRLVDALNKYFTRMVDVIYKRKGVIDKYIGDAIMAIFGAPKVYGDDVQQAVLAALEMLDELEIFNRQQREKGEHEFHIGIGINYGVVTAGNIGSTRKMDYTVIGDSVNLASRLEGLTKEYQTPIIISETTYQAVKDFFYVREIDRVRVKGKSQPVKIFQPSRYLSDTEKKGWLNYNEGVKLFLEKQWDKSERKFLHAKQYLGDDFLCHKYLEEIKYYRKNPPSEQWDGVTTMTHK